MSAKNVVSLDIINAYFLAGRPRKGTKGQFVSDPVFAEDLKSTYESIYPSFQEKNQYHKFCCFDWSGNARYNACLNIIFDKTKEIAFATL